MDRRRVALALVCCGLLVGSFVHYDATDDQQWPYPETDDLKTDYGEYTGEQTLVFGTVQERADGQLVIEVQSDQGPFTMTVRDPGADPEAGAIIQVYGRLDPDRTITADRVVVVNESGRSALYKYAASAVGALLVLVGFFRHWTVDTDRWVLEVREDG